MSEEISEITKRVIGRIHEKDIRMRSRTYFIIGSILTMCGIIASIVISTFFIGLIRFAFRSHGPVGGYRLNQLLSTFPWWMVFVAVLGLVIGAWLLRRYDFSYKIDFRVLIVGVILAVFVTGWFIDFVGINDTLSRRGFMRGLYQHSNADNMSDIPLHRGGQKQFIN